MGLTASLWLSTPVLTHWKDLTPSEFSRRGGTFLSFFQFVFQVESLSLTFGQMWDNCGWIYQMLQSESSSAPSIDPNKTARYNRPTPRDEATGQACGLQFLRWSVMHLAGDVEKQGVHDGNHFLKVWTFGVSQPTKNSIYIYGCVFCVQTEWCDWTQNRGANAGV